MPLLSKFKRLVNPRMKSAGDVMSPMSWFFMGFTVLPSLLVLFRPSWQELLLAQVVDSIAFGIFKYLEIKFFRKKYPDTALYFPVMDEEKISALSLAQKRNLFESLIRLPDRRALWCLGISVFKFIPVSIVIVFFWHADSSRDWQFLKFLAYFFFIHSYFYANIYYDSHYFVSEKIREFHARYNWTEVFRTAAFPSALSDFGIQEKISLASIFFATLYLQTIVLLSNMNSLSFQIVAETVGLGICCFLLLGRTWLVARNYFMDGLTDLFDTFQALSNKKQDSAIPLHSSFALARFEKIFNDLTENLRRNERELLSWITHESEQSRYRALGEVAGLVVHDLAGPLHTLQFCVQEIKENPANPPREYLDQIELNSNRASELITSLRAYLRNPDSGGLQIARFQDAHAPVLRLLRSQFISSDLLPVTLNVSEKLKNLSVRVSQSDLTHILYNLYKNAYENFASHRASKPVLDLNVRTNDRLAIISISDNGSGLDSATYEELTAYRIVPTKESVHRSGMGLRLTRRLVERLGGELIVTETGHPGTTFLLSLPIANLRPSAMAEERESFRPREVSP